MASNGYHWDSIVRKAQERGYVYRSMYDPVLMRGGQIVNKNFQKVLFQKKFLIAMFGEDQGRTVLHMIADILYDQEDQVLSFVDSLPVVPIDEDRGGLGHDLQESGGEVPAPGTEES